MESRRCVEISGTGRVRIRMDTRLQNPPADALFSSFQLCCGIYGNVETMRSTLW